MEECEVFVSVMYDKLLAKEFLAGRRSYNFHPGLLPEYRGSGAYSWAIMNGEARTGVTLHEIDRSIDHGRVIHQESFPIEDRDTAGSLFSKAESVMEKMFRVWFQRIVDGKYEATPQDESKARLYLRKDLEAAKDLTRTVRAFTFQGKEDCYYISDGKRIYLKL